MQLFPLRRTFLWRFGVSRGRHTFRPHFVFCVLDFGSNPTILILRMTVAHSCISWLGLRDVRPRMSESKSDALTAWLNPNVLLVFPSSQRYAVCLFEVHRNSLFRVSCFRWSRAQRSPNPKNGGARKPCSRPKTFRSTIYRRIVATTSYGKYLSRLFITLHLPQLLYPAKSLICIPRNETQDFYWASWHRLFN